MTSVMYATPNGGGLIEFREILFARELDLQIPNEAFRTIAFVCARTTTYIGGGKRFTSQCGEVCHCTEILRFVHQSHNS